MIYHTTQAKLILVIVLIFGISAEILAADGDLDTTFGDGGVVTTAFGFQNQNITDLIVQPDGKIIAAGTGRREGALRSIIARYTPNGDRDSTFGLNGNIVLSSMVVTHVALQSDGKIIVVGYTGISTNFDFYITRLNSDGSVDTSFNGTGAVTIDFRGANDRPSSVAIQPDGKIVILRNPDQNNSSSDNDFELVRLNTDGSLDQTFDGDGKVKTNISTQLGGNQANDLVIQPDGKIVAVGSVSIIVRNDDRIQAFITVRYNSDGSLDTTFDGDGKVETEVEQNAIARSVVLQCDGKIVVGGVPRRSSFPGGLAGIVRYLPNGSLDSSYGNGGKTVLPPQAVPGGPDSGISEIAIQADNKVVMNGYVSNIKQGGKSAIGRFNSNGSFDTTFSGNNLNVIENSLGISSQAVAIQQGGKVLFGGSKDGNFAIARFETSSGPLNCPANEIIAFESRRTGTSQIFTMNADGSNQVNISNNTNTETRPNLSPDGRKIAFTRVDGGEYDIFTMNVDGSNVVKLNGGNGGLAPRWSPDGSKIVFSTGSGSIIIINSDGRDRVILPIFNFNNTPSWSPDGTKIVFACERPFSGNLLGDSYDICTVNRDGSNEVRIVSSPAEDTFPVFSPDGSKIAFNSFRNGNTDIFVVDADGSNEVNLTNSPSSEGVPAWSPDGSKIAFSSSGDVANTSEIYIMNADGTERTRITNDNTINRYVSWQSVSLTPIRAKPFDFDGDGRTDASIFRNNTWFIQPSGTIYRTTYYDVQFGTPTDKLVPADYDGDGRTDLAVWRENVSGDQSYFYILQSETNTFFTYQLGNTGDDPRIVSDWDGDGKADLAVYRQAASVGGQSLFYYIPSSATVPFQTVIPWGTSEDQAMRGDFDGDGKADAAVFRPSNGVWYILQSSNQQPLYRQWGIATDKRTTGDFDGDGKDDLVAFRNGIWYVLQSSNNQARYINWGLSGDSLVAGDYDGDGLTDFAVWRAGIYYVLRNSNLQAVYQQFGASNDVPVASAFVQ